MASDKNTGIPKDLVAASATPLILSILGQGEAYGYCIIKRVRELSGGQLEWADGMLYPVLHRLEQRGLIESTWRTSEQGRRRRIYKLKEAGRRELHVQRSHWLLVNTMLEKSWEAQSCST